MICNLPSISLTFTCDRVGNRAHRPGTQYFVVGRPAEYELPDLGCLVSVDEKLFGQFFARFAEGLERGLPVPQDLPVIVLSSDKSLLIGL